MISNHMLIQELCAVLKRDKMKRSMLARHMGVGPVFVGQCLGGHRRFNLGNLVTLMALYPELTTYCYEYMVESGRLLNARRGILATAS